MPGKKVIKHELYLANSGRVKHNRTKENNVKGRKYS